MNKNGVFAAIRTAAATHHLLTVGTVLCVAASVGASLLPPLLLARVVDRLTVGSGLTFLAVQGYFCSLALEGLLSSAQESLLVLFGQKMTHALRSEMSRKLTRLPASTLVDQNPGEVAARFSGDVDTVEALFTSGIISMVADACRILSIMAVIAVKNTGLALILLLVLPLFALFTRHVQKRMLAAQLNNRRAVAAVSGQVPETLHNIRTIRALGLEDYMERRYDRRISDGYAAMERTNFYDAIYSPVVLLLNAVVVGIVMLLSASGNAEILRLFGMSVGTSVAVISYISRIFAPIESLGMEIQTIQSAMAGVKRIDAFLSQPERVIPEHRETTARGDVAQSHVTFGYGGAMTALWYLLRPNGMTVINSVVYFNISPALLIFSSVAAYFLLRLLQLIFSGTSKLAERCEITVSAGNNSITLEGIVDTGNSVEDIFGGGEVIIADGEYVKTLFGEIDPALNREIRSRYRVMPCGTVTGGGTLEAFRCDTALVSDGKRSVRLNKPILAVSKTPLKDDYAAIVNPRIFM